ncbi:MAG: Translation initiation factor, partial [Bacteriovoracaceae bacterium]|nr:Translation initiation factor [Bacteriovoracaceae bacterium]
MRLHEVAKVLGTTAKVLMSELEKHGFKYKTHMAILEDKATAYLEKKHPDLKAKMAASSAEAEDKPKKPKAAKTTKSKVVTSRTAAKKATKAGPGSEGPALGSIELVQREEGKSGTVTLEQKVVSGGVLRRRRVEAPPTPIAPPPPPPEEPIAEEEAIELSPEAEEVEVVEEIETPPSEKITPQTQAPAPVGARNLSSPTRLRIVEQPPMKAGSVPSAKPGDKLKPKTAAGITAPAGAEEVFKEKDGSFRKKPAAAVKTEEVAQKLTKKDLLGMMEEVEITRPFGRKPKRVQKIERR